MAKCTDREQFNDIIHRKDLNHYEVNLEDNIFKDRDLLDKDHELYTKLNSRCVWDTYDYMSGKFKKGGIYISVRDAELERFTSFHDERYRNDLPKLFRINVRTDGANFKNLIEKACRLSGYQGNIQKILPLDQWTVNDGLFRYDEDSKGTGFKIYDDMFKNLMSKRDVNDIDCFLNKRDFPVLKKDRTEPYENLHGSTQREMFDKRYVHDKYSPILSASKSDRFADVLIPSYEDWLRATYQDDGRLIISSLKQFPDIRVETDFDQKVPKAVFRGSTTGLGIDNVTNQRLRALYIAKQNPTLLDVGITKWNCRIRKHMLQKQPQTIERPDDYETVEFMSLQQQTNKYKYILNLEGHTAAFRLAYELSSNSVVLLAGSQWKLWYSRFMIEDVHYVAVKEDLTDLVDKIKWCQQHEDRCLEIIKNANKFYKEYLGVNGILDYLQKMFCELNGKIGEYKWLDNIRNISCSSELTFIPASVWFNPRNEYPKDFHRLPRCIGTLKAYRSAFQKSRKPTFVGEIIGNPNIQLYRTHGFDMVKKNKLSLNELNHELYIGLNAVNNIVPICANFVYTYGRHHSDKKTFFREYIPGVTLQEWLMKPERYNETTLYDIMILVNLAIITAQSQCAFIHYDLNPKNIILQFYKDEKKIDYNLGNRPPIRYKTKVVPIIINYSKSRAVVYEHGNGIVDRGIVNLYKNTSQAIDMLTLLYTVLKQSARIRPFQESLKSFMTWHKLPVGTNEVKRMFEDGAIIDYVNQNKLTCTSMSFVEFMCKIRHNARLQITNDFKMSMFHKVSYIEEMKLLHGASDAFYLGVKRLDRKTYPRSENMIVQKMIRLSLNRVLAEFDIYERECANREHSKKYNAVKKTIMDFIQTKRVTTEMEEFPSPSFIDLDIRMTPDELKSMSPEDYRAINWLNILSWCVESQIDDSDIKVLDNIGNLFEYINALASHNTCVWLQSKLLPSSQ